MKRHSFHIRLRRLDTTKRETGALLVEFVLVAPFILFLVGYIVRLTLITQAQQIAMTLSREVATTIFRGCADLTIQQQQNSDGILRVDTTTSSAAIETCLNNARADLLNRWSSLRPIGAPESSSNVTLNLTVYRQGFANLSTSQNCPCTAGDCSVTAITHTGGQGSGADIDADTMCQRNRVVRAQLQFQLTPLVAFLNLIPGPSVSDSIQIREETII
jgi:Flp pilus assembly protein TadG